MWSKSKASTKQAGARAFFTPVVHALWHTISAPEVPLPLQPHFLMVITADLPNADLSFVNKVLHRDLCGIRGVTVSSSCRSDTIILEVPGAQ
jgi:hypothetical protein